MRWRDRVRPVPMPRVALVAPVATLRAVLVQVAGSGSVELDSWTADEETAGQAAHRLQGAPPGAALPGTVLLAAVGVGGVLLAGAYALGTSQVRTARLRHQGGERARPP